MTHEIECVLGARRMTEKDDVAEFESRLQGGYVFFQLLAIAREALESELGPRAGQIDHDQAVVDLEERSREGFRVCERHETVRQSRNQNQGIAARLLVGSQ